jgi:hypothetical protein
LRSQAAELARRAATERETPQALGLAAWGGMYVTVPTTTPESTQLAGMLALCQAFLAMAESRAGDVAALLELATELAARIAEGLAARLTRCAHGRPTISRQANYWVTYGRALARLRGRRDDAVRVLRHAELILPHYVARDPLVRDVLAELLTHARRDAVGRELRGMAFRAGLPV